MNAIEVRSLSKYYGGRVGVENINLAVPRGTIFGFLGPNGAGKTTTIRVLLGLLQASHGSATILENDCWTQGAKARAQAGYLPGDLRLYPWLTADAALDLMRHIRGKELVAEGKRLLSVFDLEPRVRVKNMSRGMRQKLGLILALAHRPEVAILDEPTASLDPLMQARLHQELRARAGDGSCVFLSSHTLDEVEKLCERIAIIRDGRIVADETIAGLRARARRTVILRWKGPAPDTNSILKGVVEFQEQSPTLWRGVLLGDAMELVRWSSLQPLADLSIDEPDLASLFESFYQ